MEKISLENAFMKLRKDSETDIEVSILFEGVMDLIVAELKPGRVLSPHYHLNGSEYYQVLSGKAKMKLGQVDENRVTWSDSIELQGGDVIEVKEKIVHVLENSGDEVVRLIFIAPKSHLGDDRIFIK